MVYHKVTDVFPCGIFYHKEINIYMYVCTCVYVCIYIYIFICIYIYVYFLVGTNIFLGSRVDFF